MAMTAIALARAYTEADQAWAYHTQVCSDQEERYDCRDCRELNEAKYRAQQAMRASPEAVRVYESDEMKAERRFWSREVFQPLHEAVSRDDGW